MRILLTGASGYVGLHVLGALVDAGRDVTALVRVPERLGPLRDHPRVTVLAADLGDDARVAAALPSHDACVHAALLWGPEGTDLELRDTIATAKLFDAAGAARVPRCVYVSSAAVHRPFSRFMTEDDPVATSDVYGATKAAGELFLRAACATHGTTGIVLRPGPVVGPPAFPGGAFRSDGRLATFCADALRGRPLVVRRGEGRQLSDVAAVAQAVLALTTAPEPFPTYLCVDRHLTTWETVARMALAAAGSRQEPVVLEAEGEPAPMFATDRIAALLGEAPSSDTALDAHVAHLVGMHAR